MKLVALCGAAGAGKDTVADMLPARKLAFADALYREVCEALGVEQHVLRCRETKETETELLAVERCNPYEFRSWFFRQLAASASCDPLDTTPRSPREIHELWSDCRRAPRSPRKILQWWGDYRRAQDPDYFVKRTRQELIDLDWATPGRAFVVADVRFANEAKLIRALGGELWQIQRTGVQAGGTGHKSDTDGSEFKPERVIHNLGTLEDLRTAVDAAFNAISAEGK